MTKVHSHECQEHVSFDFSYTCLNLILKDHSISVFEPIEDFLKTLFGVEGAVFSIMNINVNNYEL